MLYLFLHNSAFIPNIDLQNSKHEKDTFHHHAIDSHCIYCQ